jgi:hypothetical protein
LSIRDYIYMANEFQLLPNPDNIPGAVPSGYQRQNINLFSLQTGLDTTEPYDNGSVITTPEGGIIEVNGALFKLTNSFSVSKPSSTTAYWIAVADNGDGTATISLTPRPGVWNPAKKGSYLSNGARTLNWVSLGTPSGSLGTAVFSQTVKGTWTTNLQKGWYYADLRSGLGNGPGENANGKIGGSGGIASDYDTASIIFFHNGKVKIKVGGSGGNGGDGGTNTSSYTTYAGGGGGGSGSGEETEIEGIIKTRMIKPGKGGNSAGTGAGGGGSPAGTSPGGNSPGSISGGNASVSGGNYGGGNGTSISSSGGAGGGGQGLNGCEQSDGSPGGYCKIYKLEN